MSAAGKGLPSPDHRRRRHSLDEWPRAAIVAMGVGMGLVLIARTFGGEWTDDVVILLVLALLVVWLLWRGGDGRTT